MSSINSSNLSTNIINTFNSINTSGMNHSQASYVASNISNIISTQSVVNGEWTKNSRYISTCWWKN